MCPWLLRSPVTFPTYSAQGSCLFPCDWHLYLSNILLCLGVPSLDELKIWQRPILLRFFVILRLREEQSFYKSVKTYFTTIPFVISTFDFGFDWNCILMTLNRGSLNLIAVPSHCHISTGMNTEEFKHKWGGEDWDLLDRIINLSLEVERIKYPGLYHHYHTKKKKWGWTVGQPDMGNLQLSADILVVTAIKLQIPANNLFWLVPC